MTRDVDRLERLVSGLRQVAVLERQMEVDGYGRSITASNRHGAARGRDAASVDLDSFRG